MMACSCSTSKFLKDDEVVLKRNKVSVEMQNGSAVSSDIKDIASESKKYIRQQSNQRFLIFGRQKMGIYILSNPDKSNWLNRTLRNVGEEPVIYSKSSAQQSAEQIAEMMKSKGCLQTTVTFDTVKTGGNEVKVNYIIHASERYKINSITYNVETPEILPLLEQWRPNAKIQAGDYYDVEKLTEERDQIATNLQNEGYYLASRDLISFIIDTTYSPGSMNIEVLVKNPEVVNANGEILKRPLQQYYISSINIDSSVVKESVLRRTINMIPGNTYRPRQVSATYNSLLNLRNFKYINIEFKESPKSNDTTRLLDAYIHLKNSNQQKVSLSLELTNASPIVKQESGNFLTNGNFGLESIISYQHKNLFGGAEQLTVEGNLLLELPKMAFKNKTNDFYGIFSAFEGGLNATLDLPTFLAPFGNRIKQVRNIPHTVITAGGRYQYRSYFERTQFNTSFGYSWSPNRRTQLRFYPIDITYVRFLNLDEDYILRILSYSSEQRLIYQYSDHFIPAMRFDYTYSNQIFGSRNNFTYLHASVESAGNLAAAICTATNAPGEWGGYELFGVKYSQYLRFYTDSKHYFYHGKKSSFVLRAMLGIGVPYGNSESMPYEKSFFGGGPTTIRAWQIRRLGPGNFRFDNDGYSIDCIGDMSLVVNLEERFPLIGPLEGAIFADMGNVWVSPLDDITGYGKFNITDFYKEIAIGTGIGFRLKISFLTLRLDFAIPIYDPGFPSGERWQFDNLKFKSIVTNFGIDYPF